MTIIFERTRSVVETRTGDKHHAFPVMNQAIRAVKFAAGFELRRCWSSTPPWLSPCNSVFSPLQGVDRSIADSAALQFRIITRLCGADVVRKGLRSFLF